MNQDQLDHLSMYDAVLLTMNSNSAIWSGNVAISAIVTSVTSQIAAINGSQTGQINNSRAYTINKATIKSNLLALTILHADAGRSYAAGANNVTLQQELKVTPSFLSHLPDGQLGPYCQNIYNLVSPIIGSLGSYGVTTASLAALQSAINSFLATVGQPHSVRSGAKAYTISIEGQIAAMNKVLKEQLDPLLTQYKTTKPLFYARYKADRKLPNSGHRTTVTIVGQIDAANDGQPIKGAHISLVNSTRKKKVTKADGLYKFARLQPGTYTLSVVANGYVLQTKTFTINVPQTTRQNFFMVAGAGGGGGGTGSGNTGGGGTNSNNTQNTQ